MEHIFIRYDGTILASDDIPKDILNEHSAGVTTIINVHQMSYLDAQKEWIKIPTIPSPPTLKHKVSYGGRSSGKTAFLDSAHNHGVTGEKTSKPL